MGEHTDPVRVVREPEVYLLGRQTADAAELDRFLADHGVSWRSDSSVAAEVLAESAGRLCYLSFAKPRPGGNKAYLNHIKESGHGSVLEHGVWNFLFTGVSRSLTHELVRHRSGWGYCLSGETLIYSERKWGGSRNGPKKRRLRDLYEMTKTPHGRSRLKLLRLRCLDEASNTFTVGRVAAVAYSGRKPVFRVELEGGKAVTCSRDHRFLTPDGWKPLHEIVGTLGVSAGGLTVHGPLTARVATNGVPAYKDREWLKQRYVDQGREQSDIAREAGVSAHTIRSWVRKHGLQKPVGSWTVGRTPWNKAKRYRAGWRHTPETRARLSEAKRGEKNPQWRGGITRFGVRVRRDVEDLRPLVFARDRFTCRMCGRTGGTLEVHHVLPIWARPDLALDIDDLAALCEACHLQLNGGRELEYAERLGGATPEAAEPLRTLKPKPPNRVMVPRFRRIVRVEYAGEEDTYDIEMAGDHHNFIANGVVTHNSQLSQRYVDESVAEYVEPGVIAADPELHALWLDAVTHAHRAYVALAAKLAARLAADPESAALPATDRRKAARQAARSVLPNATETKIFATANARALRHFLEQRGSRHAEPEIRKLANKMLDILAREAENLFGDYRRTPLPDGTFEITTDYRKV